MRRASTQWKGVARSEPSILIPDQDAVLFEFSAPAVHGVFLSMSPTVVALVSAIAGIIMFIYRMQPKQSDDEDFGVASTEVDSSSSDNFSGRRCPSRQNSRQLHYA
eukprot:5295769-Pyramimonas_sp.AAC.1